VDVWSHIVQHAYEEAGMKVAFQKLKVTVGIGNKEFALNT
jgi:hypothetical protein